MFVLSGKKNIIPFAEKKSSAISLVWSMYFVQNGKFLCLSINHSEFEKKKFYLSLEGSLYVYSAKKEKKVGQLKNANISHKIYQRYIMI